MRPQISSMSATAVKRLDYPNDRNLLRQVEGRTHRAGLDQVTVVGTTSTSVSEHSARSLGANPCGACSVLALMEHPTLAAGACAIAGGVHGRL